LAAIRFDPFLFYQNKAMQYWLKQEINDMKDNCNVEDIYSYGMHAFLNKDFEKSIEYLNEAAELDSERKLTFASRGSAYLSLDRLDKALEDFNHAIEIDPTYARAYHLRGLVKDKQGDAEGALADFSKAIEIEPEYGAAYYSRAALHSKMENEDLALKDIETVHHLSNRNIETFANENNVWRSQQLKLETTILESEVGR
jgi:tetratricopeptide (TPR) repeat protein